METDVNSILSKIFCRVTEQTAFMFAEPVEQNEIPVPEGECMMARMHFRGIRNGNLQLAVSVAMCIELSTNMLGMDLNDEQAADKGMDALKEVLNVTCGNILTELCGMEPIFELSIPEAAPLSFPAWMGLLRQPRTLNFMVDDYPVLLRLEWDGDNS